MHYSVELTQGYATKITSSATGDTEGTIGNGKKTATFDTEFLTTQLVIRMHVSGSLDDLEFPVKLNLHKNEDMPVPREKLKYTGAKSGEMEPIPGYVGILNTTLKNGDVITIDNVPVACEVWYSAFNDEAFSEKYGEGIINKYSAYGVGGSSAIIGTEGNIIDISYFKQNSSPLKIEKTVEGEGIEEDKEYTLKIKGYVLSEISEKKYPITGNYKYKVFEKNEENSSESTDENEVKEGTVKFDNEGVAYIQLKANQYAIIGDKAFFYDEDGNERETPLNGPLYAVYTVKYIDHVFLRESQFEITEVDENGYDIEVTKPKEDKLEFIVKNTRKFTGKLAISKIVEGETAETNKEFRFKIKLEDTAGSLPNTYTYTGSKEGTIEFDENREAEITLKHGEKITIEGLPVGAKYIVTEDDYQEEGYKTETKNEEGIITEEGSLAEFTNTKQPEKDVEDESEEQAEEKEEDSKEEIIKEEDQKEEELAEEVIEEKEEKIVEEKEVREVKQVQTGDVATRAVIVLAIAIITFGATYIKKKNK